MGKAAIRCQQHSDGLCRQTNSHLLFFHPRPEPAGRQPRKGWYMLVPQAGREGPGLRHRAASHYNLRQNLNSESMRPSCTRRPPHKPCPPGGVRRQLPLCRQLCPRGLRGRSLGPSKLAVRVARHQPQGRKVGGSPRHWSLPCFPPVHGRTGWDHALIAQRVSGRVQCSRRSEGARTQRHWAP